MVLFPRRASSPVYRLILRLYLAAAYIYKRATYRGPFSLRRTPKKQTFHLQVSRDSKLIPELNDRAGGMWAVGSPQVGKGTIWPALVQWLLAGGGMEPVGTWVVVAQQGTLVLQLASKCPIFHGSAEPSATDAGTHRESTLLPVLYSALMTTRTIVMAAGEARPRRKVRCALAEGLNAIAVCFMTFIMFSEIFASFKRLQLVCNSLRRR